MFNMFKKVSSVSLCVVSALAAGPALAGNGFDLDFSTDQVTTNTPWEWYMPSLALVFNGQSDGYFDEGPYIRFYGQDRSPAGHCLELSFTIDSPEPNSYFNVQVNDHGTRRNIMSVQAGYSTMRLYVRNTNPSAGVLNWALYFVSPGGAVQSASLAIRRKQYRNGDLGTVRELTRDECVNVNDSIPSAYVEGTGTTYTVSLG
jgi:hypothetical protein